MELPTIIKIDERVRWDCGCSCPFDGAPQVDYDKINVNCEATYNLISEGFTSNVFQLEASLGKHWAKEIKPKNIDDISLLISIIRPSTLNCKESDGHSVATHIIKRRNKEEEVTYAHPILESILKSTEGYQNYQEQIISVAQVIAGFNPNQADELRRGIGKKLADVIAKIKLEFMEGCKKVGLVDEQTAEQVFASAEAASRYSFNKCITSNSLLTYTDGSSETIEDAFNKTSWRGKKTYSLKFSDRVKFTCPNDQLLKNSEIIENEIEDIKYSGEQYVYRITLKRRKIADNEYYGKPNRPHFSITVTGSHKHPTRCHGEVRTDELKIGVHSLFCYDPMQEYRPKYKHAASKILKIERMGKEKVYDVTMKAPHHNFLADGVFTCNSHSVGYGTQTYITAWTKAHFPLEFYTANLRLNEDRGGKKEKLLEEKANMIKEAASFRINILPPSINFPCKEFTIKDEHTIYYGISNIKMTGDKEAEIVLDWFKGHESYGWLDILFGLGGTLKSASFENLCLVGFFNTNISRQGMVYEYNTYRKLTNKEVDWIRGRRFDSLKQGLVSLIEHFKNGNKGGISRKDRVPKIEDLIKTLENPPHSLEDTPITINRNEKELLGVALTYSDIEARALCGIYTNTTCKEFNEGKNGKDLTIAVSLTKVKEHITKKGQKMCFLSCEDSTDVLECVVFSDVCDEYGNLLVEKNTVTLSGERSKEGKSFIVNKVTQI